MNDPQAVETNLRLRRLTLGETTELLTSSAADYGYSIGATGPRAFRLARVRRKQLVRKVTESIAVALSEDRSGTVVRFVGPIDEALVGTLEKADTPLRPDDVRSRPVTQPAATPGRATSAPADLQESHGVVGQHGALPAWLTGDPSVPGPPVPAAAEPHRAFLGEIQSTQPEDSEELDGATIARSALSHDDQVELVMSDGRTIRLSNPIVLGRNPSVDKAPPQTEPIRLPDRLLSKTHALVEHESGSVWVTDLHSTNGTTLELGGIATELQAGERRLAESGSVLVLGDTRLTVSGAT